MKTRSLANGGFWLAGFWLTMAITGCSGFHAIEANPTDIQWIRNTSTSLRSGSVIEHKPYPKPIVQGKPPAALSKSLPLAAAAYGEVQLADLTVSPYDKTAKLHFTVLPNEGYQCSASFVGGTRDVLLTAAHCVYEQSKNTWDKDFFVMRGYDRGSYVASHDWECVAIYSGWTARNFRYDYAFIKLRSAAPTSLGVRTGLPANEWESIGYPSNYYSGERLVHVLGRNAGAGGGIVRMADNPFGPGSSGGPWVTGNAAIGLNSHGYDSDPNAMYGPYFDGSTTRLYEFVREGCSGEVSPGGASSASFAAVDTAKLPAKTGVVAAMPTAEASPVSVRKIKKATVASASGSVSPTEDQCELKNSSAQPYLVTTRRLGVESKGTTEWVHSASIMPPGTASKFACSSKLEIVSARRMVPQEVGSKSELAAITPQFCKAHCRQSTNDGYCLALGTTTIPVVKPLAAFIGKTINAGSAGGVASTKREMISTLGGDPDKDVDPCNRSDFYSDESNILNDGMACRVLSAADPGGGDAWRMQLSMGSRVRTTNLAYGTGLKSTSALFNDRGTAPQFEFFGDGSAALNSNYGGKVLAVEEDAGETIVTNENGCLLVPE